jgi:V-type H+-transporting ATPase subunit G
VEEEWMSTAIEQALIRKQQGSGNDKAQEDANKETDEKLKEIKEIGEKEGDQVVEDLLRAITDVKPQFIDRS